MLREVFFAMPAKSVKKKKQAKKARTRKAIASKEKPKNVSVAKIKELKSIVGVVQVQGRLAISKELGFEVLVITKHMLPRKALVKVLKNFKLQANERFVEQVLIKEFLTRILEHDSNLLIAIRDGILVYDASKMLSALKANLKQGLILGTKETLIHKVLHIRRLLRDIESLKIKALDNVYMAVVESCQAALVMKNVPVTIPKHLADQLSKHDLLRFYAKKVKNIVNAYKHCEHTGSNIAGKTLDKLMQDAKVFLQAVREVI